MKVKVTSYLPYNLDRRHFKRNRECRGWLVSMQMARALLCMRSAYTESKSGSSAPTVLCAAFPNRDRSFLSSAVQLLYHTVQPWHRVFSMVLL